MPLAMVLDDLISRRLVFLSGKGGVGKSVVGLALALAARERGKRTLLVETDSPLEASRYLGKPPSGPKETEILPGLFSMNLKPQDVMDEYVRRVVRLDMLIRRILHSPVYYRFFAAAPGLKELMLLGKVVSLIEEKEGWSRKLKYDLVVFDAPATGHGLSLMKVPMAASAGIPVGPIGHQARWILEHLRNPKTTSFGIVAVPEEMAVVEAAEFYRVAKEEVGVRPTAVILNACHERRLTDAEEGEVLSLTSEGAGGQLAPGVSLEAALLAARRHMRRRKLTRFYQARLKKDVPLPMVTLPYLFKEELDEAAIRLLSQRLAAA
jgi:anion-transporting  ArsA/GET3 family ATPase